MALLDAEARVAQHAVHAGMAGKTGMLVGRWHCSYVHVPISFVTGVGRSHVDPHGELWRAVLESTSQPAAGASQETTTRSV